MLVVAPGDEFVVGEGEDRPRADLVADAVSRPDLGMHDLRNGRRLDAEQAGDAISGDHHPLHPTRPMTEHRDEDIGDARLWVAERRAPRILEPCSFDRATA